MEIGVGNATVKNVAPINTQESRFQKAAVQEQSAQKQDDVVTISAEAQKALAEDRVKDDAPPTTNGTGVTPPPPPPPTEQPVES